MKYIFRIGAAVQAGTFYTKNYVITVPEHSTVKSSFTLRENYSRSVESNVGLVSNNGRW